MGLNLVVDKIDTVPEAQRSLYVEKEGKFHLDVDGLEDTSGLKKALKSEREIREKHEKSVKAWEKMGKTPDQIQEMVEKAEKDAEELAKKSGNFDDVLKKHLEKAAKDRAESEAKITGTRDKAIGLARDTVIKNRVGSALIGSKATKEGLDLLTERLGKRVKLDFGDDNSESVSILATDGTPMVGSGQNGLATFDDLVKEAVKDYPSLFEGSGGGGGSRTNNHTPGGKVITRKEFDALSPMDKAAKVGEKFKIIDG